MKNRIITILLIASMGLSYSACKQSKRPSGKNKSKKIRKGKPIPCPVKDC